jgi:hypothetical protein
MKGTLRVKAESLLAARPNVGMGPVAVTRTSRELPFDVCGQRNGPSWLDGLFALLINCGLGLRVQVVDPNF